MARAVRPYARMLLAGITALGFTAGFRTVEAQVRKQPTNALVVDPKADEIFKRASGRLASAKQFSFEARDMMDRMLDSGQRVQFSHRHRFAVRRPDKATGVVEGDLKELAWWYNGKTLAAFDKRQNTYAVAEVPNTLDAMFDFIAEKYGLTMPLCDLLFSDPYQASIGRVHSGVYVGLHQVEGVKCHHLAFRQASVDWQIWVQDGDEPLLRKIVITYKDLPGNPQFIALLDKWNFTDPQPDSAFNFTPPAGAKKVEWTAAQPPSASQPAARP